MEHLAGGGILLLYCVSDPAKGKLDGGGISLYIYCILFQILQRESWMEAVRVQAKVPARMPMQSVPAPQPRNVPVKAGIRPLVARVVSVFFFCMTPDGSRLYRYCSP